MLSGAEIIAMSTAARRNGIGGAEIGVSKSGLVMSVLGAGAAVWRDSSVRNWAKEGGLSVRMIDLQYCFT